MTRARAKLLEQQVNSLLIEYDVCDYENFILPKFMHLCMIRFIDNTNASGGGQQGMVENIEEQVENIKQDMENMENNSHKCSREEREAGAHQDGVGNNVAAWENIPKAPKEESYLD